MSEKKRGTQANDRSRRKYRHDGTPIWGKRSIDGPGVWVSCVKGKEKQTVGELYDLFEQLASDLWPAENNAITGDGDDENPTDDVEEDLEKQIAKELASLKKPRREQMFTNCQTNTPCVVFISCKSPVDPVQLVLKHIEIVESTGITQTRYTQRLTPVVGSCVVNVPEIQALFRRVLNNFISDDPEHKYRYKIELRSRNHNTLSRQILIDTIVTCVPDGYTVDLEDPDIFILVEVFKSVCGISIVRDYYEHLKFNVMEIAKVRNETEGFKDGEGRVVKNSITEQDDPVTA